MYQPIDCGRRIRRRPRNCAGVCSERLRGICPRSLPRTAPSPASAGEGRGEGDWCQRAVYTSTMNRHLLNQARQLSLEEQLELVETLWDDIAKRNAIPPPTDAQKAELERRLADHESHPDDVVPWTEVKASALARIGR